MKLSAALKTLILTNKILKARDLKNIDFYTYSINLLYNQGRKVKKKKNKISLYYCGWSNKTIFSTGAIIAICRPNDC